MKFARIDESIETLLPEYATDNAAGLDLIATSRVDIPRTFDKKKNKWVGGYTLFGTNLAVEIPDGFYGAVVPKSSSRDRTEAQVNFHGVIDGDYRGEIMVSMKSNHTGSNYRNDYQVGEAVGQLIITAYRQVKPEFAKLSELSETKRGKGGHGSTSEKKNDLGGGKELAEKADKTITPEKPGKGKGKKPTANELHDVSARENAESQAADAAEDTADAATGTTESTATDAGEGETTGAEA